MEAKPKGKTLKIADPEVWRQFKGLAGLTGVSLPEMLRILIEHYKETTGEEK